MAVSTGRRDVPPDLQGQLSTAPGVITAVEEPPRRDAAAMVNPLDIGPALNRQQRFGVWASDKIEKDRAERKRNTWRVRCLAVLACSCCRGRWPSPETKWPPPEITAVGDTTRTSCDDL